MKINVFGNEEGGKFLISFYDVTSKGHESGRAIALDVEDFKTLGEKINAKLESFQKSNSKTEVA